MAKPKAGDYMLRFCQSSIGGRMVSVDPVKVSRITGANFIYLAGERGELPGKYHWYVNEQKAYKHRQRKASFAKNYNIWLEPITREACVKFGVTIMEQFNV